MIPRKFFSCPCAWNFPLKIFYYNGDATKEETKVGLKKATRLQKKNSKNVVTYMDQTECV